MTEIARLAARVSVEGVSSARHELGGLDASLRGAANSYMGLGRAATGAIGTPQLLAIGAVAAGATAVAAGLAEATDRAAEFEAQMSEVRAVAGATRAEMEPLVETALEIGPAWSTMAGDVGAGMEELTKAGIDLRSIAAGAAEQTLILARAGGISMAEAAEVASAALKTYKMEVSELGEVADITAGAANASIISVNDLRLSLSMASSVMSMMNQSYRDTAVAIGLMGDAGIKGSDAGTSLRTMFLRLTPSTKEASEEMQRLGIITRDGSNRFFDAEGRARSYRDIAQVLQEALAGLSQEQRTMALQTMFGTDAIRAAEVAARAGAEGFDEFNAKMSDVSAAEVAKDRLDNLRGSQQRLQAELDATAIALGSRFEPAMKGATDTTADLVKAVREAIEQGQRYTEESRRVSDQVDRTTVDIGESGEAVVEWNGLVMLAGDRAARWQSMLAGVSAWLADVNERGRNLPLSEMQLAADLIAETAYRPAGPFITQLPDTAAGRLSGARLGGHQVEDPILGAGGAAAVRARAEMLAKMPTVEEIIASMRGSKDTVSMSEAVAKAWGLVYDPRTNSYRAIAEAGRAAADSTDSLGDAYADAAAALERLNQQETLALSIAARRRAFDERQAAEDRARERGQDAEELRTRLEDDLSTARTRAARANAQKRYDEGIRDLERRWEREDSDLAWSAQQAAERRAFEGELSREELMRRRGDIAGDLTDRYAREGVGLDVNALLASVPVNPAPAPSGPAVAVTLSNFTVNNVDEMWRIAQQAGAETAVKVFEEMLAQAGAESPSVSQVSPGAWRP